MVMADFSGAEAEELRRAISFHRSHERMEKVEVKLRTAMERKRVKPDVHREDRGRHAQSLRFTDFRRVTRSALRCWPTRSCWLKVHSAPEFFASLLNNQPMGFYSSATLVKDARRHGVKTRSVCVERFELALHDRAARRRRAARALRGEWLEPGKRRAVAGGARAAAVCVVARLPVSLGAAHG